MIGLHCKKVHFSQWPSDNTPLAGALLAGIPLEQAHRQEGYC